MSYGIYLDIIVALLLAATIFYSVVLNRRLSALRSHRAELEALIIAFNDSCTRAEAGVRSLRTATEEAARLQQYLQRSQSIRDDLAFLVDRGAPLADRLEGGVRTARAEAPRSAAPRASVTQAPPPVEVEEAVQTRPAPVSRLAERAARGDRPSLRSRAAEPAAEAQGATQGATQAAAMLTVDTPGQDAPSAAAPRSRAERELMQALRGRR